jgi:protein O-mannosyl-transferase
MPVASRPEPPTARRIPDAILLAVLAAVTFAIYAPCLSGDFLWDDPAHVTRLGLQDWRGLGRIWFEIGATQEYYPVLHSAFWIEHRWWGDAPLPYHVVNVLLHLGNCVLLAAVLRRLFAGLGRPLPKWGPLGGEWLAAALLAVHPACVESVAWITEQKNTLSTLLSLAATWCWFGFVARGGARRYAVALGLFLLALGAKTMTVTLPPAFLVIAWWKHGRLDWRRDLRPLLPWFAAAVLAGLVTARVEGDFVGADQVVPDLSLVQRTLLAARIFWFYVGTLLWPAKLTFFYPLWDVAREATGWVPHLLAGVGILGAAWWARRRDRAPLALLLLYGGTLFPVLGFFKVFGFSFSYVADHFPYQAIPIGLAGLALVLARWGRAAPGVILVVLAVLTFRQSGLYRSDLVLFQANVATNPSSWMGHHVLAHALARAGDRAGAMAHYRRAIELSNRPEPRAALAALLVREPGFRDEAIGLYEAALRVRPTYAEAHVGLANELVVEPARRADAIAHYETALQLRPKFGLARDNLALALAQVPGREADALPRLEEMLRLAPQNPAAHFHLGNVLLRLRRPIDAIPHYEAALQAQPESAEIHAALANALATSPARLAEAFTRYERALELDPTLPWVHYQVAGHLAAIPEMAGDALKHASEALRLQPEYVEALNLMGVLHARAGRVDEARAAWNRALQIDPGFEPARRNLGRLDSSEAPH